MLVFVGAISLCVAVLLAMMKKEDARCTALPGSETRLTLGIKVFVITFVVLYLGLVFFTPNVSGMIKTQEIETCDPDF